MMKVLPADVSPQSPVDPHNDVFTIIPAGGEMKSGFEDELSLPVNHKTVFRHDPDLRGHRVYLRLQYDHQARSTGAGGTAIEPLGKVRRSLDRYGRTNTTAFDVPANPPAAKPCVDTRLPERFDGHLQTGNNR